MKTPIVAASLAMVAAQAADVLTMVGAFAGGVPVTQEANPLGRAAFAAFGSVGVILPKLLVALAIVGLIALMARYQPRRAMILAAAGILIGLVGVTCNTASWLVWIA